MKKNLAIKLKESLQAVFPIVIIILLLHATIAPMPGGTLALMLSGAVLLIVGLTLFSLGTDMAMMPMGEYIGSALIRSRKLLLLIGSCFVFGFVVTIAEPDLQVLTKQVPSMPDWGLVAAVAAGVGIFLVLGVLRILFRLRLSYILMVCYAVTFVVALASPDYLAVAFDASAVTTGPVTVPFLLAMGMGIAITIGGRGTEDDNFGLCGICSIGPILAVLIMGLFYSAESTGYQFATISEVESARQLAALFAVGLAHSFREVLMVVVPIVGIFSIYQVTQLRLSKTELVKMGVGLLYLMIGLTIFLTGVNWGFMPAGKFLGSTMGELPYNWVLIPVCLLIGACVVAAEPAVHVLTKQVEQSTSGAVSRSTMLMGMALGVGLAMSLTMLRMMLNISIWWILIPGYLLALGLTFFVPNMFVGIGFDSGGVAAGAMSAAFVLPFTIGVCNALGGNIMIDAFGVVGIIAMMPPITIQLVALIYGVMLKRGDSDEMDGNKDEDGEYPGEDFEEADEEDNDDDTVKNGGKRAWR